MIINDKSKSQPIIITGMHRSGTSLMSSLIQSAGVNVGDQFLSGFPGNPYGHFEDFDFQKFQDNILTKKGLTCLTTPANEIKLTENEIQEAKTLINSRKDKALWGWKDPRTSLFLDFWYNLLPNAKFIFVYRHPVEVFLSLLKREDTVTLNNIFLSLKAWNEYNLEILKFYEKNSANSILCNIHQSLKDKNQFHELLKKKIGLHKNTEINKLYHNESLNHFLIPEWIKTFINQKNPQTLEIYNKMQQIADVPLLEDEIERKHNLENIDNFSNYVTSIISSICKNSFEKTNQIRNISRELQAKESQLQAKENQLQATYNSWSWKITKPSRALKNIFIKNKTNF